MMKHLHFLVSFALFFATFQSSKAQIQQEEQLPPQEELLRNLNDYFSVQKEVAYLHLNKTLLLQGEQLGVSAYVTNKSDLQPSVSTSNLYVQIKNAGGDIIREEILLVEEGVTSSVYNIDGDFAPGDYTITAFTNWMRNFDEKNYFVENIKVIEPNNGNIQKDQNPLGSIDAQFLPESGHLLQDVLNHVGIIVKDRSGSGLAHANVLIKDDEGMIVRNVELNKFGIGRFSFIPEGNKKYMAVVSFEGKEYPVGFDAGVEPEGVILSATQRNSELRLLVNTNSHSLPKIQDKSFILAVQGRKTVETFGLQFEDRESIPLILDLDSFDSGVNIVTLFDKDLQPLAERLVFNYSGLNLENLEQPGVIRKSDSLEVNFAFNEKKDRMVSISVLPQNTISYNPNHNIISYNLLRPFLNGTIENGGWYFKDIDDRKKYELDNLLLTQGWSSYDWSTIFNSEIVLNHPFEKHIAFKAHINKRGKKDQRYVVHATSKNPADFFEIPGGSNEFVYDGFRPVEGEKLIMSRLRKNNDLLPAELSIQFSPSKIPYFQPRSEDIPSRVQDMGNISSVIAEPAFSGEFFRGVEELGEVELTVQIDKLMERERELDNKTVFSDVSVITPEDLRAHHTLAQYLSSKGLRVIVDGEDGSLEVQSSRQTNSLTMFLDDMRMSDNSYFYNYPLRLVDYVEIDKSGISHSVLGGGGSVKVYTDFTNRHAIMNGRNRIKEIDVPLAYSRKKTFYIPKYENTSNEFFQKFGVIGWKPELISRNGEDISFTIKKPEVDFQMIIEGFTADGNFIYDVKTVSIEE